MQKLLKFNESTFLATVFCLMSLFNVDVFALNNYSIYQNENGVEVTEDEYNIIIEAYGEEFFENMTIDDYEWFKDIFIEGNEIEIDSYYNEENAIRATMHSTSSKKITIVKSCSTTRCTIVTTTQWLKNPVVRSYDVIGARFEGTSLYSNSIITRVIYNGNIEYSSNLKQYSSGFGVSVKLPSSSTSLIIDQKFYVNPDGKVFASYQHATENISLATSKLYTLGVNGYGNVFNFYGAALNIFDQMAGVNITL